MLIERQYALVKQEKTLKLLYFIWPFSSCSVKLILFSIFTENSLDVGILQKRDVFCSQAYILSCSKHVALDALNPKRKGMFIVSNSDLKDTQVCFLAFSEATEVKMEATEMCHACLPV